MATLDYYTPEELMERFPQVERLGWNASKIGIFFSSGLLVGHSGRKERKALILESSFIELIEFANTISVKKQVFTYPKQ